MWGDLLTSFDGKAIVYDAIGNPTSIGVTENGSGRTYTWEHGRQLSTLTEGSTQWTYEYNADGMRTKRSNGTSTYEYTYNGSQLTQMKVGTKVLNFTYDANGMPLTVTMDGNIYYYITNVNGDVIRILDSTGATVVNYTYDAWGKPQPPTGTMAATLGAVNPLRYRGYIYDEETGLYYLQSRYYDPEMGRFINADSIDNLGKGDKLTAYNLFSYCGNNPVMGYDPTGCWDWKNQAGFGIGILAIGLAILLAAPTGGGSLVLGGMVLSSAAAATVGAGLAITGTVIVGNSFAQANIYYAKESRKSQKERSTGHPSWVSESDIDLDKSAQENATKLLNDKYGQGNWIKGPRSEFNQIVKWITRSLLGSAMFWTEIRKDK